MRELILGGIRSGKSHYAEKQAAQSKQPVVYIATARTATDSEMAERVAVHRERRPADWQTIEAPLELPEAITEHCIQGKTVLVDCLTLWLSNLLCDQEEMAEGVETEPNGAQPCNSQNRIDQLIQSVEQARGYLLLVSNETGFGVVPMNALARRFCDAAGNLHQALAGHCERVTLMVAGLPLTAKEITPSGEQLGK